MKAIDIIPLLLIAGSSAGAYSFATKYALLSRDSTLARLPRAFSIPPMTMPSPLGSDKSTNSYSILQKRGPYNSRSLMRRGGCVGKLCNKGTAPRQVMMSNPTFSHTGARGTSRDTSPPGSPTTDGSIVSHGAAPGSGAPSLPSTPDAHSRPSTPNTRPMTSTPGRSSEATTPRTNAPASSRPVSAGSLESHQSRRPPRRPTSAESIVPGGHQRPPAGPRIDAYHPNSAGHTPGTSTATTPDGSSQAGSLIAAYPRNDFRAGRARIDGLPGTSARSSESGDHTPRQPLHYQDSIDKLYTT